ncbi:hypothetical protein FACS189431_3120 [Alphaproteobacteria bacterium]|nr:hypothetical protein FACS189431_3120 [Alphaproteobacteria bacterium]
MDTKNTNVLAVAPQREEWQNPNRYDAPLVLTAIKPAEKSAYGDRLEYGWGMPDEMSKTLYDEQHINTLLSDLNKESIEYVTLKQKLDKALLVWLSLRSTTESNPNIAQVWADSFTEKSVEIYGAPDQKAATELLGRQIAELDKASGKKLSDLIDIGIEADTQRDFTEQYKELAMEVNDYIFEKYGNILDSLGVTDDEIYDADGIKAAFDRGMAELAKTDQAWEEWSNELVDSAIVTAITEQKKNTIGRNRSKVTGRKLKQIFIHEVLTHDIEAVNGEKSSKKLAYSGMPDYDAAMEGKASFNEFAFSGGELENHFIDHYVNIALAMGLIDGRKRTRQEMIDFIQIKEQARTVLGKSTTKPGELESFATKRANRYFRGTPGNDEVVGVFTKDIAYLKGFVEIAEFIKRQKNDGKPIGEIMDYLSSGMFDPNNPTHIEYVKAVTNKEDKNA